MEIFHYCNIVKFKKILESKKLWLTPVTRMRDREEVDHLYKNIWPLVKENILKKIREKIIKQNRLSFNITDIQNIFELVDKNSITHELFMPYCVCF